MNTKTKKNKNIKEQIAIIKIKGNNEAYNTKIE